MQITNSKGQLKFTKGVWSFCLFYPHFVKTNVEIGLALKTVIIFKWFNKWSSSKYKSLAILFFGFGFGVIKDYDPLDVKTNDYI